MVYLFLRKMGKGYSIVAAQAASGTAPEISGVVFQNKPNRIMTQAFFCRKVDEGLSIIPAHASTGKAANPQCPRSMRQPTKKCTFAA